MVAASATSCTTGHNLQHAWARCLVVVPYASPKWWEQMIGRFHRPGQLRDEVRVDVALPCAEAKKAIDRALAGAVRAELVGRTPQKLLAATRVGFDATGTGAAWAIRA